MGGLPAVGQPARIAQDDPLLVHYPEALFMVRVSPTQIFINCPRYVHRRIKAEASKYVPRAGATTPVPAWKRIDIVQPALAARDQGKADAAGGLITIEDYMGCVMRGEG